MFRVAILMGIVCGLLIGQQSARGQAPNLRSSPAVDIDQLKKENELLKKENELLKKEIELLKKEAAGKSGDRKTTGKNDDAILKTTVSGVDYEVISAKMNGRTWELTLGATSTDGDQKVWFRTFRVETEDGKPFASPENTVMNKPVALPEGKKVQIKVTMNRLPANVKKFARVELSTINQFGAVTGKPITVEFDNVPIER